MSTDYDVLIIGGGPAGYIGAIRAAQLGFKTGCIEMRGSLGGTCLNVGCMPSKALLHSSELYDQAQNHFSSQGLKVSGLSVDMPELMKHKDKIVGELTKGVEFLFKKNKIDYIKGKATLLGDQKVSVNGEKTLTAKHIVLATGSEATPLPGVTFDEEVILSSTGALTLSEVPSHLVVVGAGVIGLELGSVWKRLGAKVTVVEYLDRVLPGMDHEVAKEFQKILTKQGFEFKLGTKVDEISRVDGGAQIKVSAASGGKEEVLEASSVLVAIGRRPFTEGLGLEQANIALDERGRIKTGPHYQTTAPGVYAIGDVITGPMLAHKAEEEGVVLMEHLAGQKPHLNYDLIPGIVYTWPEVANVGKTEEDLKNAGVAYKVGKFPFMANGRAKCVGMTDGFVKMISDANTDRVLGCHIVGPNAGDLIHEVVAVMEFGGSAEDIARTCHAHPTFNEAVKEAALAIEKRTLNF